MRNRLIAAVLLAALLVTGLGAALAAPGSAEDPFVTLSYLTETFYPEMEQAMLEQIQNSTAHIEKAALDRLAELSSNYLAQIPVEDKLYSDKFLYLTLSRDEALTLSAGSSLQFQAGRVALTFSSGCLIDATDGTTVSANGKLTAGHHYIAAENTTCTVTAVSDAVYLSVCGYYTLQRTGITYTPFIDIAAADWYADPVLYAYQKGLVNGMTAITFEPMTQMNRAMLATLLYRMAGAQSAPSVAGFTDVPADAWFADSVNWAYAAGIVKGTTDTTFSPSVSLSREQMAVFLYRYATQYLGQTAPLTGDLTPFPDTDKISDYARDAMVWAVGAGLIRGKDGKLAPLDKTNRAEVATVLQRFNALFPY